MYMNSDVEVFKTSVQEVSEADWIITLIQSRYPIYRITFDLQDCDKVLRVENQYGAVERDVIHQLVNKMGYQCEVLQD